MGPVLGRVGKVKIKLMVVQETKGKMIAASLNWPTHFHQLNASTLSVSFLLVFAHYNFCKAMFNSIFYKIEGTVYIFL